MFAAASRPLVSLHEIPLFRLLATAQIMSRSYLVFNALFYHRHDVTRTCFTVLQTWLFFPLKYNMHSQLMKAVNPVCHWVEQLSVQGSRGIPETATAHC